MPAGHPVARRTRLLRGIGALGIALLLAPLVAHLVAATVPAMGEGAGRLLLWAFDLLCVALGAACLVESTSGRDASGASLTRALRRFGKGYSACAIVAFTSCALFLAANLVVGYVRSQPGGRPPILEARYPDLTPEEIDLLLDETWNRPYVYAPWTGFREAPRGERFVNVHAQGFRRGATVGPDPAPDLAHAGTRVFCLGGSTTFGYGVDDASTLPARLELRLRERFPGLDVRVYNFGRGLYYSAQEVALLVDLLRQGHLPDLVVMIDGLNEGQAQPHYTPQMARMFALANEPSGFPWVREAFFRLPLLSGARRPEGSARSYFELAPEEIVAQYVRNRDMVRGLASSFGFRSLFFVQPVPGYRNSMAPKLFQDDRKQKFVAQFLRKMELLEATADGVDSFSMTALLADHGPEAFVDAVHYAMPVNDLLAAFIAEHVDLGGG
jgi:hypothetical protein